MPSDSMEDIVEYTIIKLGQEKNDDNDTRTSSCQTVDIETSSSEGKYEGKVVALL